MLLRTDAWVADTCHLSIAARGAYMDLLVLMWRSPGCRVPNDNGWLQQHLHMTKDDIRNLLRPVIEEFCRCDGNYVCQKRLLKEYDLAQNRRHRASVRAKRRWEKEKNK